MGQLEGEPGERENIGWKEYPSFHVRNIFTWREETKPMGIQKFRNHKQML